MKLRAGALLAAALSAGACVSAPPPASQTYADYLIGRTANLRDDHSAAADRYFAALARSPSDPALIEGAVEASLAIGDADRARQAARMAGNDAPALARLVRAADAMRASNWRRAGQEIDHAEGDAAEEFIGRMMQVWARVAEGRADDVLAQLQPLSSIRPYGGLFVYQQAMALELAGRRDEAIRLYGEATASSMFLPAGVERYANLLVEAGRREDAIAMLRAANSTGNPELAAALATLEGGGALAIEPLTPARGAAIGLYGLGAIFLQEHDADNGMVALSLALMLEPSLDSARLVFAEAHASAGNVEIARRILSEIAPASPYFANARVMEAWALVDAGRAGDAIALVQSQAAGVRTQRALADIYRHERRYGEAEPLYSALIAEEPENWRYHFSRGAARERLGRWSEAEADLRRALELAPDQPEILNYLGYMWVDRGEHQQEAMGMIRRAVELRPNSGAIIDSLGWAYYRLGDYDQALLHLERAVELAPSEPTLNDHLGDLYWRMGRRIEARYQWQRALALSPEDPAAIEAKLADGLPALPATRSATR